MLEVGNSAAQPSFHFYVASFQRCHQLLCYLSQPGSTSNYSGGKKNTFCPTNTQQITASVCWQLLSHTGASAAAELCPSEGRANKGFHLAPGAPGGFAAGSDLRPKCFISLTQNGSSGFVHGPGAPPAREELNHGQERGNTAEKDISTQK